MVTVPNDFNEMLKGVLFFSWSPTKGQGVALLEREVQRQP